MSKIFVTGDVHGEPIERLSFKNFSEGRSLSRDDVVIIAGDFGVFFGEKEDDTKYRNYCLRYLDNRPFTVMFIGGNHENWTMLNNLPMVDKFGTKVGQASENVFFIPNGTMLNVDGRKIFCFGGAMSTDKDWRIIHESKTGEKIWWEEEVPSKDEMDYGVKLLEDSNWKVDIVITHTMPTKSIEEYTLQEGRGAERSTDPTARYLSFLRNHGPIQFEKWYCGHFHMNKVYDGVQCLFDYIVNPDDEPMKNYGWEFASPL